MHLFWDTCNLDFKLFVRFGYHALHAKSKCGCIKVLHSIRLRRGLRYFPCLYKNLSLPLIFVRTFRAISRPDRVSSKRQPRYSTVENCFRVTPFLFMVIGSALILLFFGLNRIDLVLSSPKWMDNLLSTNQSHRLLKSVLSFASISDMFLWVNEMQVSSAYSLTSQSVTASHWCIKEKERAENRTLVDPNISG